MTDNIGLFEEFKGALTENFVLQNLYLMPDANIYYWSSSPYEVDFIIQIDNDIFPVEAKSGSERKIREHEKLSERVRGTDKARDTFVCEKSVV